MSTLEHLFISMTRVDFPFWFSAPPQLQLCTLNFCASRLLQESYPSLVLAPWNWQTRTTILIIFWKDGNLYLYMSMLVIYYLNVVTMDEKIEPKFTRAGG